MTTTIALGIAIVFIITLSIANYKFSKRIKFLENKIVALNQTLAVAEKLIEKLEDER